LEEKLREVQVGEGLVYETVHQRKDGTTFPIEASLRLIALHGAHYYQAIVRDISTRKRAEEALQQSEEQLRLLLDSTAEGIFGIDLTGACTFCNAACLRLLGYRTPLDLLGKNVLRWSTIPGPMALLILRKRVASSKPFGKEWRSMWTMRSSGGPMARVFLSNTGPIPSVMAQR
jgi:PAS domain S-box-containing protein